MKRRRVLRWMGAGSVVAVAGCGDGGGTGDGSDDSSGDGSGSGSSDGGSTGSDGGSGGTDSTTTAPQTTTEDPVGPGGTPTATETGLPEFDDFYQRATSHRLRMELDNYAGNDTSGTFEGVWVDGDFRMTVSVQGQSMTYYTVDGTTYATVDGQCLQGGNIPDFTAGSEEWSDPEADQDRVGGLAEERPVRTDSYEGEQMYVYELDPSEVNVDRTVEYWVSTETGYVRRVVMRGLDIEYWDWGQVSESISAPC